MTAKLSYFLENLADTPDVVILATECCTDLPYFIKVLQSVKLHFEDKGTKQRCNKALTKIHKPLKLLQTEDTTNDSNTEGSTFDFSQTF